MSRNPDAFSWTFDVADEAALPGVAYHIAPLLKPGIAVALIGDLGAGKTAFARALLRLLSEAPALEVPSPTYTLVQEYPTPRGAVSHFDLYRISGPDELEELGFADALGETISLIEWSDRAADLPPDRIEIAITMTASSDPRRFKITGLGRVAAGLARQKAAAEFIARSGWGGASRTALHGDASTRAYELLEENGKRVIFMNDPARPGGQAIRGRTTYGELARLAGDLQAFCMVARGLAGEGFISPNIYAHDIQNGFLLLEYFGTETIVAGNPSQPIVARYEAAVDVLVKISATSWSNSVTDPDGGTYQIPVYDQVALLVEAELVLDWFFPATTGAAVTDAQRASFLELWTRLAGFVEATPPVWVLRDYHSPNLHWLGDRAGTDRIGLIDFQDAVLGHPAYDLVSLLQDARVTVGTETETRLLARYLDGVKNATAFDKSDFRRAYAILGAQRNTKILGIFVRLAIRDGKTGYLKHLPRISSYLIRNLEHPALGGLAEWYRTHLPQALAATPRMFDLEGDGA